MKNEKPVYERLLVITWYRLGVELEAAPGFEPGIKDLQSSALPLGYAAAATRYILSEAWGAVNNRPCSVRKNYSLFYSLPP